MVTANLRWTRRSRNRAMWRLPRWRRRWTRPGCKLLRTTRFGRRVGWATDAFIDGKPLRLLEEEQSGVIFLDKQSAYDGGVRTGTGIGQRDVRVTPLQAANLVVTLLHGGQMAAPRIVSEIRYADGGLMANFPRQLWTRNTGRFSRRRRLPCLRRCEQSSPRNSKHALASAPWPLAGKSGTAELRGDGKAATTTGSSVTARPMVIPAMRSPCSLNSSPAVSQPRGCCFRRPYGEAPLVGASPRACRGRRL